MNGEGVCVRVCVLEDGCDPVIVFDFLEVVRDPVFVDVGVADAVPVEEMDGKI